MQIQLQFSNLLKKKKRAPSVKFRAKLPKKKRSLIMMNLGTIYSIKEDLIIIEVTPTTEEMLKINYLKATDTSPV